MKRRIIIFIILFAILSIISVAGMVYAATKCPLEIENDPYPGKCGLYVDDDGDKICDLSEIAPAKVVQSPTPKPTEIAKTPATTKNKANTSQAAVRKTPVPSKALVNSTPTKKQQVSAVTESSNSKKPGAEPDNTASLATGKNTVSKIPESSSDVKPSNEVVNTTFKPGGSGKPAENQEHTQASVDAANESIKESKSRETFLSSFIEKMFSTRNLITLVFLSIASFLLFLQIKWRQFKWLRYVLLGTSLVYLGFVTGGCPSPIGSVQQIPIFFSSIVQGKALDWVVVLIVPIVFAIFFGRVYCGGVCPFGAVQEFVHKAGTKLRLNVQIKSGTDRILKNLRYIFLGGLFLLAIATGTAWLCRFDPFAALFNFNWTTITLVASVIMLIASFINSRPFCRYICPYGVLLALVSRAVLVFKMKKLITWCKNCTICEKSCPTGAISRGIISESECIRCGECIDVCPVKEHKDRDVKDTAVEKVPSM
ncbi:MAG TPA: 4Fe-4S binding protein [Pseudobacteroides sp.]|uniref:4Fe-4S binding protein n=1 Tax=Pseudobacteroides sp. TaxID=1968840 RepID=UPI002F955BCB